MRPIQWLFPLLLISEVIFVSASPFIAPPAAIAAQQQSKRRSAVDVLKGLFQSKPRAGATRGPACVVTPGLGADQRIWSDRPLFVWAQDDNPTQPENDRAVGRVEVYLANDNTSVIWSQPVPANARSILYTGAPLQPGQTYKVRLLDLTNTPLIQDSAFDPEFTLLTSDQRQKIASDLASQEKQLRQETAPEEMIALQKAIYFAEQQLWSDAFQTAYTITTPPPALKAFIQTTIAERCPKTKSS
jgi:hypothetical protein